MARTLDDQVKISLIEKNSAEAEKANAERNKINFDFEETKKDLSKKFWLRKDFKVRVVSIFVWSGFVLFALNSVIIPAFEKRNLDISIENSKITKQNLQNADKIFADSVELKRQGDSLAKASNHLKIANQQNVDAKSELIKIKKQLDGIMAVYNELNYLYTKEKLSTNKAITLANKKLAQSLSVLNNNKQAENIFNAEFIRTNIRFTFDDNTVYGLTGKISSATNSDNDHSEIDDRRRAINWTAYLQNNNYKIAINSDRYKLDKDFVLKFSQKDINNGYAYITVPLTLK